MTKRELLKISGLLLSAAALTLGGCASTPPPAPEPEPVVEVAPEPEPQPVVEEVVEQVVEVAPAPVAPKETVYRVMRGDNLWNISGKSEIYGNPYKWPLIYKRNAAQIKDADLIYPGQEFTVDLEPSAFEVDAAVEHARTRGAWSLGRVEESDRRYLSR